VEIWKVRQQMEAEEDMPQAKERRREGEYKDRKIIKAGIDRVYRMIEKAEGHERDLLVDLRTIMELNVAWIDGWTPPALIAEIGKEDRNLDEDDPR
jgi:hypothetical protein